MDYLDIELMNYQRDDDARCVECGEYITDEWACDCDDHLETCETIECDGECLNCPYYDEE